jgi:electron transport complex protein RnfC
VTEIRKFPHAFLGEAEAIEILTDTKEELGGSGGRERRDWESVSSREIAAILRESGVVETEAGMFPVHLAIERASTFTVDAVVLNGCESEPYLTSDHALMMSHPVEILKGGELLRRAFGAKELVVAVEENKEEVAELFKSKVFFHSWSQARVEILPTRYPQEEKTLLLEKLFGRSGMGLVVLNVATAYAAYEAVGLRKPAIERAVTIGGECVAQPHNYWLRVGTLAEEAVKFARGFLREPGKVVFGGPMKGEALAGLDVPVLSGTRGILGLPPEVVNPRSIYPCIHCGQCVESCPVSISPVMITLAAERELFDVAQDYGASLCISCGNCAYVCPSGRPMVELIQYANRSANAR